jgi:FkbM family methyltransferase
MKTILRRIKPLFFCRQIYRYFNGQLFPKQTYAQLEEDIVIQGLLGKVEKFIDIGANDGFTFSNTFLFALNGAAGLCFEPVRSNFRLLNTLYLFNSTIQCISEGISNQTKEVQIQSEGLLSAIPTTQLSLSDAIDHSVSKTSKLEEILVKPLTYWVNMYPNFSSVDLVNIDVEGHELNVIQGIDFSRFKTRCFIIETHGEMRSDYPEIKDILGKYGYHPLIDNGLNMFWLSEDWIDLVKAKDLIGKFPGYRVLI